VSLHYTDVSLLILMFHSTILMCHSLYRCVTPYTGVSLLILMCHALYWCVTPYTDVSLFILMCRSIILMYHSIILMCHALYWCVTPYTDGSLLILMCHSLYWCVIPYTDESLLILKCYSLYWCVNPYTDVSLLILMCYSLYWCSTPLYWCVTPLYWYVTLCTGVTFLIHTTYTGVSAASYVSVWLQMMVPIRVILSVHNRMCHSTHGGSLRTLVSFHIIGCQPTFQYVIPHTCVTPDTAVQQYTDVTPTYCVILYIGHSMY